MRVKEISYAKKVGLPNYGSLGLSVTAELETVDQFNDAYHEIQTLVDDNLNGILNGDGRYPGAANARNEPAHGAPPAAEQPDEPATQKQWDLIKKLCSEQGKNIPEGSLSKAAATNIINNLLDSKGSTGGNSRQEPSKKEGSSPENESMTEAQRRYLFRLLSERDVRGKEATEQLKAIFGVDSLSQVTKSQANAQIERFLGQEAA